MLETFAAQLFLCRSLLFFYKTIMYIYWTVIFSFVLFLCISPQKFYLWIILLRNRYIITINYIAQFTIMLQKNMWCYKTSDRLNYSKFQTWNNNRIKIKKQIQKLYVIDNVYKLIIKDILQTTFFEDRSGFRVIKFKWKLNSSEACNWLFFFFVMLAEPHIPNKTKKTAS